MVGINVMFAPPFPSIQTHPVPLYYFMTLPLYRLVGWECRWAPFERLPHPLFPVAQSMLYALSDLSGLLCV